MVNTIACLWQPLGAETPARVILVQDAEKTSGYQIALITTDPTATPAGIIERYAERWPIEVCFKEGKELFGVGDPLSVNRTQLAVKRTVPFQFLTITIAIIWYAAHGHHPDIVAEHRARAPGTAPRPHRRSPKCSPNSAASSSPQYHPGQGQTPAPAQNAQVQHACAAASL